MNRVEKYIQDYTRGCSNELSAVEYSDGRKVTEYHEWLTPDNARAVAEITKDEMIEKACKWLRINAQYYWGTEDDIDLMISDFCEEMDQHLYEQE